MNDIGDGTHIGSLSDKLSILSDHRVERTKRHSLTNIMVIAICAVVCGADSWVGYRLSHQGPHPMRFPQINIHLPFRCDCPGIESESRAIAFSILVRNDCHRIVVIPLGQSCHISAKDQTGVKRAHQRTTTPENAIALRAREKCIIPSVRSDG